MKDFAKVIVFLFIMILAISSVNASELDDNIQGTDAVDLEIDENVNLDYQENNLEDNLDDSLEISEDNYLEDEDSLDGASESSPKNLLKEDSATVHKITQSTYSTIFNARGYVLTDKVSSGDIIDLSGSFNKKNFIFTIPCSITSTQNDAFLTNCMVKFENVTSNPDSHSFVSNLRFNTSIEMSPCVYLLGSSYIDVFNNNAYSTGANSNPTFLVGSSYCNVHDNIYETTFTGYMNMSWKRAGILLGESHYNSIYSNHVTVKDSNPIYLTTYGYEKSNYNVIFNNTVTTSAFSEETGLRNPSAWAYGVHIMGDYNQILNNTIMNTYRGVDSEGSFNLIVGNKIFNLSGSYYEGNNGTDGGEGGIFASYDNIIINNTIYDSKITGPAIYAVVNTTVIGNVVRNITGPNGLQFALTASNCLIENNTIQMNDGNAIYVKGNMSNLTLSKNILSAKNGTGILIQKQTRAKFPVDVNIMDNIFLEDCIDYLDYSDVEGKTIVNLRNNTVVVVNDTFFKVFGSDGFIASELFENFIFKGQFSDLKASDASQVVSTFNLDGKTTIIGDNAYIKDISFNVNGDDVRIDNIILNITDASSNAFNFLNVKGGTLVNSVIYFNSTKAGSEGNDYVPIFASNSNIILNNNTIIVYSDNSALVLNNSNCSLIDNIINSSSLNHPVVLNDNYSCLLLGENEINSLFDPAILSINGASVKYLIFIIEDSNYYEYFNPDGSFLDDVIFNFGDTIRIGNVNNKVFRFDIPLVIVGQEGCILNNSYIILEGESSNSLISNFTFKANDFDFNGDISFITIKDGVSDLLISNNKFIVENLSGENAHLNAIKIDAYETYRNISIVSNDIAIVSNLSQINGIIVKNEGYKAYDEIIDGISIVGNSISIVNQKDGGNSMGIGLLSSGDGAIADNRINVTSYSVGGISLSNCSDLRLSDNIIEVYGLDYEGFLNLIQDGDFDIKEFIEDNGLSADSAISADKSTDFASIILESNVLIENNGSSKIIHSDNPSKDLEYIIKMAEDGESIDLGNNIYLVSDSIDINKSIGLENGILISNLKDKKVLFNILSDSNDTFNVSDALVFLDNGEVFALVNGFNDTNYIIDVPSINISNNDFRPINNNVVGEAVTIVKLISGTEALSVKNEISILNNQIASGMKLFDFDVDSIHDGSDVLVPSNTTVSFRSETQIIYQNMTTTAVDVDTDGRSGEYFYITLKDKEGKALANKPIQIGFNGNVYDRVTDGNGQAKLQINLRNAGTYTFAVCYLGDDEYNGSFVVAKIVVNKQKPVISTANYYYKASAKSKKISISLKSASKKPLKNKTVKLVLNGKTYSGKTNSNGVVTISVSLSKKGTYSFTAKYAGDNTHAAVSKSAKLTIS